jgi:hypothetical protein
LREASEAWLTCYLPAVFGGLAGAPSAIFRAVLFGFVPPTFSADLAIGSKQGSDNDKKIYSLLLWGILSCACE